MSLLEAIVLGIVQGLTEFLPISSTGHLRIVPAFLGWEDPGAAFTAVTQLGTMAAVLWFFRKDLWRIALAWFASVPDRERRRELDARLGWYILLGTVPIGVFGVLFQDQIETGARDLYLLGAMFILFGLILGFSDWVGKRRRRVEDLRTRDGFWIGMAQALALIPGVSRSGVTIAAGLLLNLDRQAAARFSFLLSVPAVVLSGLFELSAVLEGDEGQHAGVFATVVATVIAFFAAYYTIGFLLRWLTNHSTAPFVAYRVVLGVVVLALAAGGTIE